MVEQVDREAAQSYLYPQLLKLDQAFAAHRLAAAKAGRERIVAWLRTYPPVIGLDKMSAWNTAAHIERGEHER